MQNYINKKKVIVFDWDGTLFDSMAGKVKSFSAVVSMYFTEMGKPISSDFSADIYLRNSGKPRAEIFREVAKEANFHLEQYGIDEMSSRLFLLNRTVLAEESLFPDALRLLNALANSDLVLYISSSVPQAELDYFVSNALPKNLRLRFSGVFGSGESLTKGPVHIARITMDSGHSLDKILVIGDDEADFTLSEQAGVDCILVDRDSRFFDSFPQNFVNNLDELCNILNLTVLRH
jgi:phosphoglycolate phosphatase-like HAD superfamily hydrolase